MPSNDLNDHAVSETDFYALLGVTFETSQRDIDRAWRQTALKYHPDKVGDDPVAKEKFHLAQIGYDLLSDPASKVLYDSARNARIQKERRNNELRGKRRTMAEDLFNRERGFKRERDEREDEEERLEMEVRRLAEDGRRRRKEREDTLRKEMQIAERNEVVEGEKLDATVLTSQTTSVSEIDRTVKVRWPLGDGQPSLPIIGQDQVINLFSKFGKIESADLLNPKPLKSESRKKHKKQLMATCMVQYSSIVGAYTAVEDFKKQQGREWERFHSVFWAAGIEPQFVGTATQIQQRKEESVLPNPAPAPLTPNRNNRDAGSGKSVPSSSFNPFNTFSTPSSAAAAVSGAGADGPLKMPSFASFPSAAFTTPTTDSPARYRSGVSSPSFEEMMMIRLKNAEKKRLEGKIRKPDETVVATTSGGGEV